MWYIDLSGSVSHTALCEALLKAAGDKKQDFTRLFIEYMKNNTVLYEKTGVGKESNPLLLNEQCKGITPLDRKQALELAGDMSSILDTIISLSEENTAGAYDMVIYLALLLLMEKLDLKKEIKMLFPRIGTESPETVFHMLKGIEVILDPLAPAVTPLCSAFLAYYRDLFVNVVHGILTSFTAISDPVNSNIRIQLFECDDWYAGSDPDGFDYDIIGVLETNIDDCTPEVISGVLTTILDTGALDYTITPVIMKKGRSGFHIQVLCQKNDMGRIAEKLLKQTSSFGLRMQTLLRKKLKREIKKIQTAYGEVRVKLGYKGNEIIKATPEFDDLLLISRTRDISLFNLYNEITGEMKKRVDCFKKDDKITRF